MGRETTAEARRSTRRSGGPGAKPKLPGAKRPYGPIPPGTALVEPDGRVNLANADVAWAFAHVPQSNVALPMINAQRHLIGLLPVTTGAIHPRCGGVELHPHAMNTSTDIARELNTIGVDNREANRTTVNVVRVKRAGCGTRYLILRFGPEALKARAAKNTSSGVHHEGAKSAKETCYEL